MSAKLIGKKLGMMQVFSESGEAVPCTVIQIEPNLVTQVKTQETDGYAAVQVASVPVKGKSLETQQNRTKKPQREFFKKLGIAPQKKLLEFRVEKPEEYAVGQALGVALFAAGQKIDITGTSIGKGYQGVVLLLTVPASIDIKDLVVCVRLLVASSKVTHPPVTWETKRSRFKTSKSLKWLKNNISFS
jgi:large subunit ribosomal protein L3